MKVIEKAQPSTTRWTPRTNGSGLEMLSVRAFASSCNGEVLIGQSDLDGAAFHICIPVEEKASNKPTGGEA